MNPILLVMFTNDIVLGCQFCSKTPLEHPELRREINILERTAQSLPLVSEEEKLLREKLKASAMNMRRQLSEHRSRQLVFHILCNG